MVAAEQAEPKKTIKLISVKNLSRGRKSRSFLIRRLQQADGK
jgi:hypothetical protein